MSKSEKPPYRCERCAGLEKNGIESPIDCSRCAVHNRGGMTILALSVGLAYGGSYVAFEALSWILQR